MSRSSRLILLLLSLFALCITLQSELCHASTALTQQLLVNFDGTLSGADYNLAPGEIDVTGTFSANGSATVSGGEGDIPGDLDPTTENAGNTQGIGTSTGSGFWFDAAALGALETQNWVTESVFTYDVPLQDQPNSQNPDLDPGLNGYSHLLGVQGDTFYRVRGFPGIKTTEFGYWDGTEEVSAVSADPTDTGANHAALVWDATATTLTAYMNGVFQDTIDQEAFDVSTTRIGYGFFARFFNRAMDGKLDAVAFSTFEGDFDAASDFQLVENSVLGDFDSDGDVDGSDFLLWQRDQAVGDLSDWQTNFGSGGALSSITSVPEAGSAMLLCLGFLGFVRSRNRQFRRGLG